MSSLVVRMTIRGPGWECPLEFDEDGYCSKAGKKLRRLEAWGMDVESVRKTAQDQGWEIDEKTIEIQ